MRFILMVILAGTVGWAGYWFIGSKRVTAGLEDWFEMRRSEGWQAEYGDMRVGGFPNRFDTTLKDVAIADPNTGVAWQTPVFQMTALSYKPQHVIAIWPNTQVLATPLDTFDLNSKDMRASLIVNPAQYMRLERTTVTAEELQIAPRNFEEVTGVQSFSMAAELEPEGHSPRYHLGLRAANISLSDGWLTLLDPQNMLPKTLEGVTADLDVEFDSYWDQLALEQRRPQPRVIDIRLAEARWGELLVQVAGSLTVDETGAPSGEITIKAENWQQILELAKATGQIPEGMGQLLEDGLGLLANMSGNTRNLDVPLTFKSGQMRVGILPLGPAPQIYIR